MTVTQFKRNFSQVLEKLKEGEEVAVTYGKQKEVIGYFVRTVTNKMKKRKLGILTGKAKVSFRRDFKMTDEEFLGGY